MKKDHLLNLLGVSLVLLIIFYWDEQKTSVNEKRIESSSAVYINKMISAGGDFDRLVSFIEKNSYAVFPAENSVLCNYQCIFYDSDKRMNLAVITKRDSLGNPSIDGKVGKVDVRIYRKYLMDSSLDYTILRENIPSDLRVSYFSLL